MSGLIKWLLNTGHFTFWGDLTKVIVTIVCIGKLNWNLALWLPINDALLTQNFAKIEFVYYANVQGFFNIMPYW